MALHFEFNNIPFTVRAEHITDPEYIASIRSGNSPRSWYELEEDNDYGVKPGIWLMASATEALIWLTMAVNMGQITEKNWRQFYTRVAFVERVFGARRRNREGGHVYFTPAEVKDHIGLTTNVAKMTDAQFTKHTFKNFALDCERDCNRMEEK